jgi:hypothetical protein
MTPVAPVSAELLIPANADQGARPIPWAETRSRLAEASTYWLAVWVDDALHSTTNPGVRKGRNLAGDPRCCVAAHGDRYGPRSTRWEFAASARLGAGS